jgi:hypothetical protein
MRAIVTPGAGPVRPAIRLSTGRAALIAICGAGERETPKSAFPIGDLGAYPRTYAEARLQLALALTGRPSLSRTR